jgi:hypothetical protein
MFALEFVSIIAYGIFGIYPNFAIVDDIFYAGWEDGEIENYLIYFPETHSLGYYTLTGDLLDLVDYIRLEQE